jgi:AhpD family alkylhydroperoxidase
MEEVVGSIPTRSTKLRNNLTGSSVPWPCICVTVCVMIRHSVASGGGFHRCPLCFHADVAVPFHISRLRDLQSETCRSTFSQRPAYQSISGGARGLNPSELMATYVSSLNDCYYCQTIHGAIAAAHLDGNEDLVRRVKSDFQHADISDKLIALLVIAAKVASAHPPRCVSYGFTPAPASTERWRFLPTSGSKTTQVWLL